MTGVTLTSPRLEQLLALRDQVDHAITQERARLEHTARLRAQRPPDPATVRAWAQEHGLIPPGQARGKLPKQVVRAYLDHQNGATT